LNQKDEKRLRELIAEKLRRKKEEGIRYVKFNGGQMRWFREIEKPDPFIVVNAAGNGLGKTYSGVAILGFILWPHLAPKEFRIPLIMDWKFPKRARIVSTPKEVEEIGAIQTTIKELWPKSRYTPHKKGKNYPSQFKTDTGWVVDVMTFDQNQSEFAGPNLGLLLINEPPPEPIFKECLARTRKGALVLVAMTTLFDTPWVADGILDKADGKDIRVIYADIEENCKVHGTNGTLEHDQIEKILAQFDPDEREARKTGKPITLSGALFKAFNQDVHVLKDEPRIPSSGVQFYQAIDPAIGKPFFCIWGFVDANGFMTIYDEYPDFEFRGAKDQGLTVKDYVKLFRIQEQGRHIGTRIMDRHFASARRINGGLTLRQEFMEAGLEVYDSYHVGENTPELETGFLKIKEYLRYDRSKPLSALNRPKLTISPKCTNLIASLRKTSRDSKTGKQRDNEYKDGTDCLRYMLMSNPEIWTPSPATQSRHASYGVRPSL
jgi:hypothetical protein